MRKLNTADMFAAGRVAKRIGIKDLVHDYFHDADNADDLWEHGFEFLMEVLERACESDAEQLVYKFLAGPYQMQPSQIGEMSLEDQMEHLKQLATENDLRLFFKQAAGLMQKT